MSAHATQAEHHDDPGQQAADARQHRQALRDLIDMGTGLARLLHGQGAAQAAQQATAPVPQPPDARPAPAQAPAALVSLATAFDQVARAVRRCIMLAQALDTPRPPAPDPARHRTAARKRILREVEDTIQRTENGRARDRDTVEALTAELRERLDAPDLDWDITSRPVADIIKDIRRDLGLDALPGTRPFKRRTPADVAQLCARAAAPSGARQPAADPQGPRPHGPAHGAPQRPPELRPDKRGPDTPTLPLPQPGPAHPGGPMPDDPAEAVALILRHPADARWRPPPEG